MLLLSLVLALAQSRGATLHSVAEPPDVLVIVADDLGWPEWPLMPNVQALAAQGTTFSRAYSWPVCSPTRFAAMFGELPRRAGIGNVVNAHNPASANGSPAPDRRRVSIAEALAPTHAAALVGKWHLGRATADGDDLLGVVESGPFVSGFDVWRAGSPVSVAAGPGSTGYRDWYRVHDATVSQSYAVHATEEQRDQALAWWGKKHAAPRFLWLAFCAPHQPYEAPPGYPQRATDRETYEDMVAHLDDAIGDVLAQVDLSETFVVFMADNGTPNNVHPPYAPPGFWKGTTYEGGIRVPLVVAGPGVTAGATTSRLVSAVDLPATLLDLVGVESRGFADSRSFADALGPWTGSAPRGWVFAERYDVEAGEQPAGYDDVAIVEAAWKWRRWDPDGDGPEPFTEALYYLPTDPYEQVPIAPAAVPAVQARMAAQLATTGVRP